MTLALLGTILLVVIVVMAWRRGGTVVAVLGFFLGIIVAGSGGALAQVANALVTGTRDGMTALASTLF